MTNILQVTTFMLVLTVKSYILRFVHKVIMDYRFLKVTTNVIRSIFEKV